MDVAMFKKSVILNNTSLFSRDCDYVEFSKLNQDKVIGTDASLKEKATVWDIESKKIVREFSPQFR